MNEIITGAADEILLGSVALDVSGRAHSLVVVVRGRRQPDPNKRPVLLGMGPNPATTRRSASRSTPPSGAAWSCWPCMRCTA